MKLFRWAYIILNGATLIILIEGLGAGKGLLWFLVVLLVQVLVRLVYNWEMVYNLIKQTETAIFSKPLERAFWQDGELRNTKFRFKFRKKKKKNKESVKK